MWLMIASSISSPPTRSDCETTIPPREMTGASGVPPPMAPAGRKRRLFDGTLLDARHAGRHADDDARVREAVLVHLLDEVAQHLLGDVEVGDHAVLERTDRADRPRLTAEHALGLDADRVHLAAALVDRDHARLREHDAAAAHVHERVRGSEVDSHVAAAEA